MRQSGIWFAVSALAISTLPVLAQTQISSPAAAPTAAPPDAQLYIIAPPNGARLRGPFVVQFGLRNMGVTQAGVTTANTGHHHILVDAKDPVDANEPIPADKTHIHFGAGQTETRLELPPGRHTLQLVLGDAGHRPFKPNIISEKVEITVLSSKRKRHRGRRRA